MILTTAQVLTLQDGLETANRDQLRGILEASWQVEVGAIASLTHVRRMARWLLDLADLVCLQDVPLGRDTPVVDALLAFCTVHGAHLPAQVARTFSLGLTLAPIYSAEGRARYSAAWDCLRAAHQAF